ncbi:hypothetical protein HanOQP8_Chr02g0048601 [Helianthus annuus]|nr:hypothetical protein HanOQP8_Chr02g0048601 [Helianthus annuus]
MHPRFIMMMIDDQFKDIPKDANDVLGLRNMTSETITRLTKGTEERAKDMICRISKPAYIAPENDRWRHENSDSDNEDERMSEMVEKKTRWWFVRDGKKKNAEDVPCSSYSKGASTENCSKGYSERGSHKGLRKNHNKDLWMNQC